MSKAVQCTYLNQGTGHLSQHIYYLTISLKYNTAKMLKKCLFSFIVNLEFVSHVLHILYNYHCLFKWELD